jgi:hypothetical protein
MKREIFYLIQKDETDRDLERLIGSPAKVGIDVILQVEMENGEVVGYDHQRVEEGESGKDHVGRGSVSPFYIFWRSPKYILKSDGSLFEQDKPLTDREVDVLREFLNFPIGLELEEQNQFIRNEIDRITEYNYRKVEPLSPLDPRAPLQTYEVGILNGSVLALHTSGNSKASMVAPDNEVRGGRPETRKEMNLLRDGYKPVGLDTIDINSYDGDHTLN